MALNIYMTTDFAVTEDGGDYTELAVWGVTHTGDLYALDWWYGQKTMDVWVDELITLVKRWKPMTVWGEAGVIRRAVEPFLLKRCRERGTYFHMEWLTRHADKAAMARAFQGRCSMGKVFFPKTAWADRVIEQCIAFPAGKHDDAVDACALIGLALENVHAAYIPTAEKKLPYDSWARLFRDRRRSSQTWKTM